jgi:hypothetical protein
MRSRRSNCLAVVAVGLVVASPCWGQNSPERQTLEDLTKTNESHGPDAASEAKPTETFSKRPAGTLVRPKDGIKHPDLANAWAEYDAAAAKTTDGIRAATTRQFDAAAAKGDLDAAEKWQTALERFEKAGEVPLHSETNAAVTAAVADYKKARNALTTAYESVVKALTIEKKIAEAKTANEEWRSLTSDRRAAMPLSSLGKDLDYRENVWSGVWKRRGDSNVWDCKMSQGGETVTYVVTITAEERRVKTEWTDINNSVFGIGKPHVRMGLLSQDGETVWFGPGGTGGLAKPGPDYFVRRRRGPADPQGHPREAISTETQDRVLAIAIGAWRHPSGSLEEIREGGQYVINGNTQDPWSGKWTLDVRDPKGPCIVRNANNGTITRWYADPTRPDQLVSGEGGMMRRAAGSR